MVKRYDELFNKVYYEGVQKYDFDTDKAKITLNVL